MHIRGARRYAKEQRRDSAQQRGLSRFVIAINDEEVRLMWWDLDCSLGEMPVANQIDAIDAHADSNAERRASRSASASSMAVATARVSRTMESRSSVPSLGRRFFNSAMPSHSDARDGSARSSAKARII